MIERACSHWEDIQQGDKTLFSDREWIRTEILTQCCPTHHKSHSFMAWEDQEIGKGRIFLTFLGKWQSFSKDSVLLFLLACIVSLRTVMEIVNHYSTASEKFTKEISFKDAVMKLEDEQRTRWQASYLKWCSAASSISLLQKFTAMQSHFFKDHRVNI